MYKKPIYLCLVLTNKLQNMLKNIFFLKYRRQQLWAEYLYYLDQFF